MSGICGMLALKGAVPDEHALIRMVDSLHHSEGERAGHRIIGQCGLGLQTHITTHENPLFVSHAAPDIPVRGSPQQAVEAWIVKDGLAFNHADIRAALTAMRHRFKTGEDTETLLRSYIQFGPENFIKPYRGQFTLAIWDETHHRLTLLRDRLGQKPIYYAITDEWVVFSSKIKSVLEHPAVGKRPNLAAIPYQLAVGFPPPGQTMFEGVNILPPGHMLTVQLYTEQDALPDIEPYWQPPLTETGDDPRSEEDIAYELLAHLRWATGLNRFGAREIGIFLQGGLSSSALLALLLQQTSDQVTTFSVNLPGGFAHDEMSVIRKLRARYVTRHIDIDIDPNVPALIDRLLWLNDEPFGDAGVVMAHAAYEAMSEHVPVVLMGNGGDELFAGYEDFRIAQIARQYDRLPDIAQRAIGGAVERLPTSSSRQGVAWRISQVAQTANLSLAERYLEWIRYVPDEWFNQILGTSAATAVRRQYSTHFDLEGADGFIAPLLDVNIRVHLPYDQLVRLDHVAGAAGLNVRLPFMDHHLVQFAAGIPASLKLKRGISRYILRQALAEVLPRRVLDSRGETGLPAPVDDWFRGDVGSIAQKALLNEKAAIAGLFDTDPVHVMLEQHRSGAADLGRALWPILILELWMQRSFV